MNRTASQETETDTRHVQPEMKTDKSGLVRAPVSSFEMRSYAHPEEYTQLHPSIPFFISKQIKRH